MPIFPQKKKTVEITYVDKRVIIIGKEKWHHHDYELQQIKKKLNSMDYKLDKLLKGGETTDDSEKIQALIDKVDIIIEDIKKTI